METATRINLVKSLRETLGVMRYADAELALNECGSFELDEREWSDGDRELHLTRVLRALSDEGLQLLGQALATPILESPLPLATPQTPVKIFISHPSTSSGAAQAISECLHKYKVLGFVAHADIQPDMAWRQEISRQLNECEACVALLAPGFHMSDWCEQEVGWMLGRGVPTVSIRAGEDPRGPFSERQSLPLSPDIDECTSNILQVLESYFAIRAQLARSYVRAMRESGYYRQTDLIWARLRNFDSLTVNDCAVLWYSAKMNSQVSDAWCRPEMNRATYPAVIQEFISKQQSFSQSSLMFPELFRLAERLLFEDESA